MTLDEAKPSPANVSLWRSASIAVAGIHFLCREIASEQMAKRNFFLPLSHVQASTQSELPHPCYPQGFDTLATRRVAIHSPGAR